LFLCPDVVAMGDPAALRNLIFQTEVIAGFLLFEDFVAASSLINTRVQHAQDDRGALGHSKLTQRAARSRTIRNPLVDHEN
jgi:hypothetical protein